MGVVHHLNGVCCIFKRAVHALIVINRMADREARKFGWKRKKSWEWLQRLCHEGLCSSNWDNWGCGAKRRSFLLGSSLL